MFKGGQPVSNRYRSNPLTLIHQPTIRRGPLRSRLKQAAQTFQRPFYLLPANSPYATTKVTNALDVECLAQGPQACFVEGLAQGRVGVDLGADVFEPRSHLECQAECAGEFGHTRADRGNAENHVIVGPCGP